MIVNDRFEVLRTLREDGQTRTHLALDNHTGHMTVIKELDVGQALDWKSIELFERESAILKHLEHPAIPQYIDAFRDEENTRLFLVQKHIEGDTLESLIHNGTRFDEQRLRDFLAQMLDVLTYLHKFSPPVVHRDINPTHIVCDQDGRYYLMDFGAVQTIVQDRLGGSTIVGSSGYMPPEQLLGRAQPATDIYALAATAVHLASGVHPADLAADRMKLQFRNRVSLSAPLCSILEKMLEPDISQRFTRPEQILNALQTGQIVASEANQQLRPMQTPGIPQTSAATGALVGFDNIQKMIASKPVANPVSDIQLNGQILTISITTPWHIPWIPIVCVVAISLFVLSFFNIGLCCFLFPVLIGGPFLFIKAAQRWGGHGYEQITLAPQGIQFVSLTSAEMNQDPQTKQPVFLPMSALKNCYLEAPAEKQTSHANTSNAPIQINTFVSSGIYFVDVRDQKHYFRTSGITKAGNRITISTDAFPEIQWIYDIVQAYLQTVTSTPPNPNTPALQAHPPQKP